MGARFARCYVRNPLHGVPFLGPSEMQLADLNGLPLVSAVRTANLDALRVHQGWILVSRSGAIGNFCYVRKDMNGLVGSDDIIRIVPRPGGAPSGYIYAFLRSDIGIAMLRRSTYGAVIQHIEPEHIADLPVPRLPTSGEQAIHEHVEEAASKRAEANGLLDQARERVYEITGVPLGFSTTYDHGFAAGSVPTRLLNDEPFRLDSYYYVGYAGEVRAWTSDKCQMRMLGEVVRRVFNPPIFRRVRVERGVPYLLGAEVYQAHPRPNTHLATWTPNLHEYLLRRDTLVFEDAGQRYGLLGTPAYVGRTLAGNAATNNMTRIVPHTPEDAAYLFALLRTDYGRRLIVRQSYGTSLPHILPRQVEDVPVPWPDAQIRSCVAEPVLAAIALRDDANDLEDEAQEILRRALDAAPATNGPERS